MSYLSRRIQRYDAYLGRYVRLGRPEFLDDADIDWLASFFNVDSFELGDRRKARPD